MLNFTFYLSSLLRNSTGISQWSLPIYFISREREEKEKRSPSVRRRSKSPRPAPRRRARIVPRYMVQIPKIALDMWVCFSLSFRFWYHWWISSKITNVLISYISI